jgi:hypothetical protein
MNDDSLFMISKPALRTLAHWASVKDTNAQNMFRNTAGALISDSKPKFRPAGAPLDVPFTVGIPDAVHNRLVALCGKLDIPRAALAELVISYLRCREQ